MCEVCLTGIKPFYECQIKYLYDQFRTVMYALLDFPTFLICLIFCHILRLFLIIYMPFLNSQTKSTDLPSATLTTLPPFSHMGY